MQGKTYADLAAAYTPCTFVELEYMKLLSIRLNREGRANFYEGRCMFFYDLPVESGQTIFTKLIVFNTGADPNKMIVKTYLFISNERTLFNRSVDARFSGKDYACEHSVLSYINMYLRISDEMDEVIEEWRRENEGCDDSEEGDNEENPGDKIIGNLVSSASR